MNIFDPETGRIIPYEVYNEALFAELDPASAEWHILKRTPQNAVWHHHAAVFRKKDNTLLLFGGYGNRRYTGELILYNLTSHVWDTIPLRGDRIDPRFYTSAMMTASEDTLYIYGGKGNPEGLQDLGTKYYYDFYLIDLPRRTVKKLWDQAAPAENRVPARTLIPGPDRQYFYAITYPEYRPHSSLQLYRINMADGAATAVGDSIPLISEEIMTNVALYSNPALERIYCVVQQFEKYGQTTTSLYSIAAPPVTAEQLLGPATGNRSAVRLILIILAAALLALIAFMLLKRRKAPHRRQAEPPAPAPAVPTAPALRSSEPKPEPEDQGEIITPAEPEAPETRAEDLLFRPSSNYIALFGPFTVLDAKGRSVTHLFSPKLKLIFLYIFLHSVSRSGVTSSDLNATFWADKEPDKAKNLRNVTLNKLRKAIADIEGITLNYEQGVFRIETESPCSGDIERLCDLTGKLTDTDPSADKTDEINSIILRGRFLADTPDPIFDFFRQRIETFLEKYLTAAITRSYKEGNFDLTRRLSDALLATDPLSETALTYLIRISLATGRHDRAQAHYKTFTRNYIRMMGEPFPRPFSDFT